MDNLDNVEKSILQTIAYFDIFNFPLNLIEIYKNLYLLGNAITFNTFLSIINNSEKLKEIIDKKEGFYFLRNREKIIDDRKVKYILSYKKYKLALKFINKLSFFSCFKCIGICNNLSLDNSSEDSDIDLFIISKENRIWTSRFIAISIAKILNLRPKNNHNKNKICLSFYIDERKLNIERVSKNNNIHFIYWLSQFVPIYDNNIFNNFVKENNWIKKYLIDTFEFNTGYKRRIYSTKNKIFFKKITDHIFSDRLENFLKKLQIKIFSKEIKEKVNLNDDVFFDDYIIKLHTNDRREEYKNKFEEKMRYYGNNF